MTSERAFLQEQLLAEHSKNQTMRLVAWVGHDASRIAALMDVFLGNEYRLTQRAAWVLGYLGEQSPALLEPWLPKMVAFLRQTVHDAVKRNVVRLFQNIEVPEDLLGELADVCFSFLADPKEAAAIRAFSIVVLEKICQKVPELKPELRLLLQDIPSEEKPAVRNCAAKALKKL